MSSLNPQETAQLEKLLNMSGGYVLDFSDGTFGVFFGDAANIDIHSERYRANGASKAKKLREFWKLDEDIIVGKVLLAMIERAELIASRTKATSWSADSAQDGKNIELTRQCRGIANRLLSGNVNLNHLKNTANVFDARHLGEQIRRMEASIENDPSLAIGTAKELIETCCKTILSERGKPVSGSPDIQELTKKTLKELELVPEGIHESGRGSDVLKRLLQNLGAIGNGLAELRGLYGTGHGKHGKAERLDPRHAKLAVGAASTLATFLFDTHIETKGR